MAVDLEKLADELSTLNVLEASQLVKMLEEKWGVSAAAPVAVAAVAAGSAEPQAAEEAEEKTEFDVVLKDQGPKKVEVIKVVRQLVNNLSLVEAKTLVETAGAKVLTGVSKEAAEDAKSKLEAAGAVVEVA